MMHCNWYIERKEGHNVCVGAMTLFMGEEGGGVRRGHDVCVGAIVKRRRV